MSSFRHSLVHDCVQRLDNVEINFIVVIPNTCFPPRDGARERAHIVCGWPGEPGHASDREDLGYERGMKNDVSEGVRSSGERVSASIECFFEKLVDNVKIILQRRRSDFSKVFDEDVQKGANERKGI